MCQYYHYMLCLFKFKAWRKEWMEWEIRLGEDGERNYILGMLLVHGIVLLEWQDYYSTCACYWRAKLQGCTVWIRVWDQTIWWILMDVSFCTRIFLQSLHSNRFSQVFMDVTIFYFHYLAPSWRVYSNNKSKTSIHFIY